MQKTNAPTNQLKDDVVQETYSPEQECLTIFDTLSHLPEEVKNLKSLKCLSKEVLEERKRIIKKLRAMADYLAKTHSDVLIADRVGTGVGIGSGVLFIGGLIAAPFTAGLSLGLTATGTATGILGGITSAGANITGYFMSKYSLAPLQKELEQHYAKLQKLSSSGSKYLTHASRFRPTMEQLAKLSDIGWTIMLTTLQKLVTHALNGEYPQISKAVNNVTDPNVKKLLQNLPLPLDSESLHALADVCTQIISHVRSIKDAIKAFLNYLSKPELARLAMIYTRSAARTTTTTVHEVAELKSAFKGTPMAMTKTARAAAGVLTAAFIVVDVIHMVRIWNETGETPTVQQLREMADELEKEILTD